MGVRVAAGASNAADVARRHMMAIFAQRIEKVKSASRRFPPCLQTIDCLQLGWFKPSPLGDGFS